MRYSNRIVEIVKKSVFTIFSPQNIETAKSQTVLLVLENGIICLLKQYALFVLLEG